MRNISLSSILIICVCGLLGAGSTRQEKKPDIVSFSPDGERKAVAKKNLISIYDIKTKKELMRLNGHKNAITVLEYSPDGKRLASASFEERIINVWQTASGRLIFRVRCPAGIASLQYTANGKTMTVIDSEKTERVFDAATGKLVRLMRNK